MSKARFIISEKKVLDQYNIVKDIADIVSYSSKTNPNITQILEKETDCMFSIHLPNELINIKDRTRVLFLAQAWDSSLISRLTVIGIKNFVVDNENDLNKLVKFLKKNKDIRISLLLRAKLKEYTIRTEKYFVFGMSSESISKKLKELRGNNQIEKLGVHFHRKTQNIAEWDLQYEISSMFDEDVLSMIDLFNIGGGIPSVYANTNEDVIRTVIDKIISLKSWLNKKNIKMMIEPGRFIAAPAGRLITEILDISDNNIIVNASVYNTDLDALIVPVKLLVEGELPKGSPYIIKGCTPCSMDLFRYRVYLDNPKVGDKLTFLNAGAYNFSSDFCNLEKLETVFVD
ncbi:MAG: decarboxylase [Nanoarchaeota archaeon]